MDELTLVSPSAEYAQEIAAYRDEFPADRMRVTPDPDRIPGLDGLEEFSSVEAWLAWCEEMRGKVSWYMSVRKSDGRIVGFLCLRHKLEYDDDDPEFASHIGYSVRPSERRRGYARRMLAMGLDEARKLGLERVMITCSVENEASRRTILANGGVFDSTIFDEEDGELLERCRIEL